jgi:hypothetical protein
MNRELLKQVLKNASEHIQNEAYNDALSSICQAIDELAKPEQEPFCWYRRSLDGNIYFENIHDNTEHGWFPLYTYLNQPLSDETILQIVEGGEALDQFSLIDFARAIEKAHGLE